MQTFKCPDCGLVLHRVQVATEKTKNAGAVQLAQHAIDAHVMPYVNAMLELMSELRVEKGLTIEDVRDLLAVRCAGCERFVTEDNYLYVRSKDARTRQCCSKLCLQKAQALGV